MGVQTLEDDYKEMALLRQWEDKLKQQSTVNKQNTEDDLKILLRNYLLQTITNTSFIHLCDQATYVWETFDTIRIRSPTSCRVIRRSTLSVGRSTFNPHLPSGFSFLSTRGYRLPGVEILEHRRVTIQGVSRRVAAWRGSLVFLYISDGKWRRFDLGRSWTSDSRGWVLGQDEENSKIARWLYLSQ